MKHAHSLVFLFLLVTLFACNHAGKQPGSMKPIDTTSVYNVMPDTAKPVSIKPLPVTKSVDTLPGPVAIEDKIIDTIFKLKEVKEWGTFLEQQTKGKRHLKIWIADTPDPPGQKYYWVKAGEDNGTNLVSQFNFFVYPASMKISYFNTAEDTESTLEEWRKKADGWQP